MQPAVAIEARLAVIGAKDASQAALSYGQRVRAFKGEVGGFKRGVDALHVGPHLARLIAILIINVGDETGICRVVPLHAMHDDRFTTDRPKAINPEAGKSGDAIAQPAAGRQGAHNALATRSGNGDEARRECVQHRLNRSEAWPVVSALSCAARLPESDANCRRFKAARQSVSSVGGERAGKREDGLISIVFAPSSAYPSGVGRSAANFRRAPLEQRGSSLCILMSSTSSRFRSR